jgi:hypothetical protein
MKLSLFNESIEIFDFKNVVDFSEEELNQVFNSVEDIAYFYRENQFDEGEQKIYEKYLTDLSVWVKSNKEKIENFNHPYLSGFLKLESDLENMDNVFAKYITPIYEETLYNWLEYLKSEDCFYSIKGKHKINENQIDDPVFEFLLNNATQSVKIEKLGCQLIFVASGKASECYVVNGNGKHYKEQLDKFLNKDTNTISGPNKLDGDIIFNDKRYIIFSTAKLNTESQNPYPYLKDDQEVFFLVSPLFNPKFSQDSTFNGQKARQHGTSFLNQLTSVEFTEQDKTNFNLLPFMALINNIKVPHKGSNELSISDFTKLNPFIPGTDTYPVYRKLRNIRQYNEPKRTEALLDYFVDYLDKVTWKVCQINKDYTLTNDTKLILENIEKVILGVLTNFNKSNLPKEIPEEKVIDKLNYSIQRYATCIGLMNPESFSSSHLYEGTVLETIQDRWDLQHFLEKKNKRIDKVYIESWKPKKSLEKESEVHINDILENTDIIKSQKELIVTMIKSRQLSTKDQFLTQQGLKKVLINDIDTQNKYTTILNTKEHHWLKPVIRIIENGEDFNNRKDREELEKILMNLKPSKEYIQKQQQEKQQELDSIIYRPEKLIREYWRYISDNKYKLSDKLVEYWLYLNKYSTHDYLRNSEGLISRDSKRVVLPYKCKMFDDLDNSHFYQNNIKEKNELSFHHRCLNSNNQKSKYHQELIDIFKFGSECEAKTGFTQKYFYDIDEINNELAQNILEIRKNNGDYQKIKKAKLKL